MTFFNIFFFVNFIWSFCGYSFGFGQFRQEFLRNIFTWLSVVPLKFFTILFLKISTALPLTLFRQLFWWFLENLHCKFLQQCLLDFFLKIVWKFFWHFHWDSHRYFCILQGTASTIYLEIILAPFLGFFFRQFFVNCSINSLKYDSH